MPGLVVVFIVIAMVATLIVLIAGVIGMASGGAFNQRYANKLMRARVLVQAIAIGLFAIVLLLIDKG